jgi:hypothetical protein
MNLNLKTRDLVQTKCISQANVKMCLRFPESWNISSYGPVEFLCKDGDKPWGSIQAGLATDQLNNCQVINDYSFLKG